jgi:hypothetical protein
MGLVLQDIYDCRSGYRDPIIVGELPDALRQRLTLRVPLVHLSRESLLHIQRRHPDVTDFELPHVSQVIDRGTILQERAKPSMILSYSKDQESHRHYVAVMKIANAACEVWLISFHRTDARQIRKWRQRHVILRRGA